VSRVPERLAAALADRYRIERELGQGGMATVYLAHDLRHERDVAIKVMLPELAAAIGPDRFLREIRTTARLRHPHIVPLFDSGDADGQLWYAMPFVEGESLQDRLAREGPLPLDDAIRTAHEVASALGYAHGRGVIHRDIKPANILLEAGHAVVADFGIASAVSVAGGATLTQTGVIVGSPAYMSPEQASGGGIDGRSDLYSLGCVFYEMLTGQPPFTAPTAMVVLAKHMLDPVPPIATARPGLPPQVVEAVERLLAKNPIDRFASAEAWISALDFPAQDRLTRSGATAPAAGDAFWVAVLPFRFRGTAPGLDALAEGLTENIVTGLSRFSYLRVISRSSAARFTGESVDVRAAGRELRARYLMEGTLRQAGPTLRISAQLVDAESGAHLWAEHYDRTLTPEDFFTVQDDVASRIVSTVADMHGVLPHTMSENLRHRDPETLTPYEMTVRGLGYIERITPDEHALVRAGLERAVEGAPGNADCWALLSNMNAEEHKHGFNPRPDPLGRALDAARRAVAAAPSSHLGYHMLAQAHFFRREFQEFRTAADRAVSLNPLDAGTVAYMGILIAYTGDWERGCALAERAMQLNPHHPGWYRFAGFNHAFQAGDYQAALDVALRFNMPGYFYTHLALAAAYGKLGDRDAAGRCLRELLAVKPDIAAEAWDELGKWMPDPEAREAWIDGLRRAGLEIGPNPQG
jgi:eukaryotic-like serine/threonine-protein kinase